MMAGLVDINLSEIYCGATIISSRYVVTAAVCVANRNINTIAVVVGEHDTSTGKYFLDLSGCYIRHYFVAVN